MENVIFIERRYEKGFLLAGGVYSEGRWDANAWSIGDLIKEKMSVARGGRFISGDSVQTAFAFRNDFCLAPDHRRIIA